MSISATHTSELKVEVSHKLCQALPNSTIQPQSQNLLSTTKLIQLSSPPCKATATFNPYSYRVPPTTIQTHRSYSLHKLLRRARSIQINHAPSNYPYYKIQEIRHCWAQITSRVEKGSAYPQLESRINMFIQNREDHMFPWSPNWGKPARCKRWTQTRWMPIPSATSSTEKLK